MRRMGTAIAFAALVFFYMMGGLVAQDPPPPPDQVEEDWELVIDQTDQVAVGPQITTSMSPGADLTSTPFVAFDLNYREYPNFLAGGMQVQVWSGTNLLTSATQGSAQFATPGETVTWTEQLKLGGGVVTYTVLNGQSTTWGQFGQPAGLQPVTFNSSLTSLAAYSPTVSLANSGASWQADHVRSMRLVQVRYYAGGKLISTDTTSRQVNLMGP